MKKAFLTALAATASIVIIFYFLHGVSSAMSRISAQQFFRNGLGWLATLALQQSLNHYAADALKAIAIVALLFAAGLYLSLIAGRMLLRHTAKAGAGGSSGRHGTTAKVAGVATGVLAAAAILMIAAYCALNALIYLERYLFAPNGPPVVFIGIDALRADHLGCYGYERNTSPNLDALSEQCCIFANAYTQAPCTRPSVWNMMTSKYQSNVPARDEDVIVTEYLQSKRYRTAAFISQHQFTRAANLYQGFDVYDAECQKDQHGMSARTAESVTDSALNWLKSNHSHPFFLWLYYFDPHDPYRAPDGYRGYYNKKEAFDGDIRSEGPWKKSKTEISEERRSSIINAYDEEIRYVDNEIGRLLNYLRESGLFDDSIIIVTADHGESLGDNGNLWSHCMSLGQEEIHVPLLIKMPRQENRYIFNNACQSIDIYPTLVDLLSKNRPAFFNELEGRSLLPIINMQESAQERIAATFWEGQNALIKGNYKYLVMEDGTVTLENVATGEYINDPVKSAELKKALEQILSRYIRRDDYNKEIIEDLKAIGYL